MLLAERTGKGCEMRLGCFDVDVRSGVPCWDIGTVKVDSRVIARVAINDLLFFPEHEIRCWCIWDFGGSCRGACLIRMRQSMWSRLLVDRGWINDIIGLADEGVGSGCASAGGSVRAAPACSVPHDLRVFVNRCGILPSLDPVVCSVEVAPDCETRRDRRKGEKFAAGISLSRVVEGLVSSGRVTSSVPHRRFGSEGGESRWNSAGRRINPLLWTSSLVQVSRV